MVKRYAIYYAPPAGSLLWSRGSAWLGRDADTNRPIAQPNVPGVRDPMQAMTTNARRYGFHATIKAPMALATGKDGKGLSAALADYAATQRPVDIGHLEAAIVNSILVLVPRKQSAQLSALAGDIVSRFEPFRAPLSEVDRARRLKSELTARQAELLDRYGYPHVLDEWHMHLTLSDRLAEPDRPAMLAAAQAWFAQALEKPLLLDRLALFEEPSPGAALVRVADFMLGKR